MQLAYPYVLAASLYKGPINLQILRERLAFWII